ncbi:hypothetical protein KR067_000892 [Drosophila pandora]|nr:hypothetical protein KR067_000892 [Drosophila pandora]
MGYRLSPIFLLACFCGLGVQAQNALIFQTTSSSLDSIGTTVPPPAPAASSNNWVLVNNMRVRGGITPFVPAAPPTPEFLDCFGRCPTTPQYTPVCGSNMQLYLNEQKFNCARFCGADIQIVRRGSCEGLFQMTRG